MLNPHPFLTIYKKTGELIGTYIAFVQ